MPAARFCQSVSTMLQVASCAEEQSFTSEHPYHNYFVLHRVFTHLQLQFHLPRLALASEIIRTDA